ncbi:hypothetical protein DMH20_13090 [Escherichia coli]|nr:hypothetical protein [Escherichia coli]
MNPMLPSAGIAFFYSRINDIICWILLMEIVMPQISRTALVPYSAEQMYQLVNDVQSYPQFCRVVPEVGFWSPLGQMTAAVDVSKAGISKTFTTRNQLTSNQSILMSLVDGPFKKLIGGWKFTPLSRTRAVLSFISTLSLPIS